MESATAALRENIAALTLLVWPDVIGVGVALLTSKTHKRLIKFVEFVGTAYSFAGSLHLLYKWKLFFALGYLLIYFESAIQTFPNAAELSQWTEDGTFYFINEMIVFVGTFHEVRVV